MEVGGRVEVGWRKGRQGEREERREGEREERREGGTRIWRDEDGQKRREGERVHE